jgi:hypothetical protein
VEKDDFDWEDYINTAGMGPRLLPVQATELLGGNGSTMLRSLLVAAPADIPEEYACSPEEAAVALACCELAELPAWDETALIDAATVGGNEEERVMWGHESREQLARRISLVMKAEKAPEVMSPADGVLLLRRAGINVFHQLLDAVAWLQLGSDATLPNYRLLKGIAEPQQTAPATDNAPPAPVVAVVPSNQMESTKAGPLTKVTTGTRRLTWFDVCFVYLVETFKAGQYSTAKAFYKALESKAGMTGSPFDKGSGQNAGSLFVRDIGKPLALKTLENAMPKLREAAK